jgi:LDH2 family malate/lactate/ureidoglycolate dehydrogenase
LSGGAFGVEPYSNPARQDVSQLFIAYDIAWFMPLSDYTARMGRFIDMVKASRLRPGFDEILVPGELEERRAREKARSGVPLDPAIFDDLSLLGRELGLSAAIEPLAA